MRRLVKYNNNWITKRDYYYSNTTLYPITMDPELARQEMPLRKIISFKVAKLEKNGKKKLIIKQSIGFFFFFVLINRNIILTKKKKNNKNKIK